MCNAANYARRPKRRPVRSAWDGARRKTEFGQYRSRTGPSGGKFKPSTFDRPCHGTLFFGHYVDASTYSRGLRRDIGWKQRLYHLRIPFARPRYYRGAGHIVTSVCTSPSISSGSLLDPSSDASQRARIRYLNGFYCLNRLFKSPKKEYASVRWRLWLQQRSIIWMAIQGGTGDDSVFGGAGNDQLTSSTAVRVPISSSPATEEIN